MSRNTGVPARTLNDWKLKHFEDMPGEDEPVDDACITDLAMYLTSRSLPDPREMVEATKDAGNLASAVILSDLHCPYQHDAAVTVALNMIYRWQPNLVILNGDYLDLEELSTFAKRPNPTSSLQERLDEARQLLADIKAAAATGEVIYVPGNHEKGRIDRYLWTVAPALASLRCLTLEALLGLAELGIGYAPDGLELTPELFITHGDRFTNVLGGGSGMSARKEGLDFGCSTVTGHTHKGGLVFRNDRRGYRANAEGFCLCDRESMAEAGVVKTSTAGKLPDWHLGFTRVDYHTHGEAFNIEPVHIIQGRNRTFAIVHGEEVAV